MGFYDRSGLNIKVSKKKVQESSISLQKRFTIGKMFCIANRG